MEHPPLSPARRDQYLERLGWDGPRSPDLATLQGLHRRHLLVMPFENLDIHLGVPIELDQDRIVAKLLDQRRGGFCFELNSAFGALLASLGFVVRLMEGRVYEKVADPLPFGHLALRVELDDHYLADVGFGRGFDEPKLLDSRDDQSDTSGVYRLEDARDGELDLIAAGEPVYQLALPSRAFTDFEGACRWHQTAPESIFAQGTVCTRRTARGRDTLAGKMFIQTIDGERTDHELGSAAEVRHALITHFAITLTAAQVETLLSGGPRADFG